MFEPYELRYKIFGFLSWLQVKENFLMDHTAHTVAFKKDLIQSKPALDTREKWCLAHTKDPHD